MSKSNPRKFVLHEGDGEFFTKEGEPLEREELSKRRRVHEEKKKNWELEMALRRKEMHSKSKSRGSA